MAQSIVVTADENPFLDGRTPVKITVDWVSATGGTVSLGIAAALAAANLAASGKNPASIQPSKIRGDLRMIETIPGASGDKTTLLPTSYGLSLLDAYGLNVAAQVGTLTGRSASIAEAVLATKEVPVDSELTFTIASAGDGKAGRAILHFKESEDRP